MTKSPLLVFTVSKSVFQQNKINFSLKGEIVYIATRNLYFHDDNFDFLQILKTNICYCKSLMNTRLLIVKRV